MNAAGENWALEVASLWGERVLDVKTYRPGAAILHDGPDGARIPLPDPGELPPGRPTWVDHGGLKLRLRRVRPVRGIVSRLAERFEGAYPTALLLVSFLAALLFVAVELRPATLAVSETDLSRVPDRFVQFLLQRPPAPKRDLAFLQQLRDDSDRPKAAGAQRLRGAEGRAGRPDRPHTGLRSARRAIRPDDPNRMASMGLIPLLGAGGPAGMAIDGTPGGLGGDLEDAIGSLTGPRPGDSGGFGAFGYHGAGPGGGGGSKLIGSGPLNTGSALADAGRRAGHARPPRRPGERDIQIDHGALRIVGGLSMETVRRVIHDHRAEIRYCYNKALTRAPELCGKVSVAFTIGTGGYIVQVTLAGTTAHNTDLERCVLDKIRTWRFPPPDGGGLVMVTYPFLFTVSGRG